MMSSAVVQFVPAGLCAIAAGLIYRQSLGSEAASGWRRHAAASIPAIYTLVLLLVWVLPIQLFLVSTLDAETWLPVVSLTVLGLVLAACLPAGYFRLRGTEAHGRVYASLGVRRFRSLVTYGDPMIRLMRQVDPDCRPHLKSSTLAEREASTRRTEKIHWGLLLSSVPAAVWAALLQESWFTVYLLAANVPMNVYPIMLQRYTRARFAHLRRRTVRGSTGATE